MCQNGTVELSGAFRSGSVLDWICGLGLVPALSDPKVLSCKMTVLCFMLQIPSLTLQARQGWYCVLPWDPSGQ